MVSKITFLDEERLEVFLVARVDLLAVVVYIFNAVAFTGVGV